jgi:SWI/SNF-related matrix-associated actin-dependent regulator 1 of chromatin subfamily A
MMSLFDLRICSLGCSLTQASIIIEQRPFVSVEDLNTKLRQGKKKAGPHGISPRMVEDCVAMFEGYGAVDDILEDCERIGATLRRAIASWASTADPSKDQTESTSLGNSEDGALSLLSLAPLKEQKAKDYLVTQPALLADDVQLKEYQLLGVNWLYLLYRKNLSCILADEMGMLILIIMPFCSLI